ncbi:uroporphyrinogen-III C-methyltransferase [Alkalimarinus sediminis]|uniref:uroporphyrinogen-III C-methyltransferase n=1 Tax=Alkalimarinus sediminis TaxID=1632866 RepID=A0A9E8KQE2_9ALTE|nr:uroporphyrinogen-III C-methyltransferase [Alkalimarinus sediminis]UZW75739.1 uroporphyrinogen-III C-methyltransferase [Alkalimarinus sediminis]
MVDQTSEVKALMGNCASNTPLQPGEVALVGSGPGDPELLTLRALRLIREADIVVYDKLVSEAIMGMVPTETDRIFVGKTANDHTLPQEEINTLLVRLSKENKRVVRLKGGDPYIFGRGGEEIQVLLASDVPCRVVPGITAASGCATYAGIPLTHRDHAQSCTFVTGHLKSGNLVLPWENLARPNQTVVFYMGLQSIEVINRELQAHGMSGDMPAALVEQGTTPNQRVFIATLDTLQQHVQDKNIQTPTLIIIGTVVNAFNEQQKENISTSNNVVQFATGM